MESRSPGQRALQICMSCSVFTVVLPLSVHPKCKDKTALRLRALCRDAVRPASGIHQRVCGQLMQHTNDEVRHHVLLTVRGQRLHNIWHHSCGRAESELTNAADSRSDGRQSLEWYERRPACMECCDPIRQIAEAELLPNLAAVLSRAQMRRWLLGARREISICWWCGARFRHLWREAHIMISRHLRALRNYLKRVYTKATTEALRALRNYLKRVCTKAITEAPDGWMIRTDI